MQDSHGFPGIRGSGVLLPLRTFLFPDRAAGLGLLLQREFDNLKIWNPSFRYELGTKIQTY